MSRKGITRGLDGLGRVVIPMSIRKMLKITTDDTLEIYTEGDKIIIKKYDPFCIFCGNENEISDFDGRKICKNCIEKIKEI